MNLILKNSTSTLLQLLAFLVFSLNFVSCRNQKIASEPIPEWIKAASISSQYYIGIGSASKSGSTPDEYIQRAKNSALKDLASSISVNISGTSILSVFESDRDISNSFISEIKASTEQYLEGYEQVGSWEDKDNYWVYYRLSRTEYANQKLRKKQEDLKTCWTKYQQSVVKLENKSYYESWTLLIDAMAGVKPYVNESTEYNTGDTIIDLGSFLYSEMLQFINSLKVVNPNREVFVKRGAQLDRELLTFIVKDEVGNNVSNIPVLINYTGQGLLRTRARSDSNGRVLCELSSINSQKRREVLSVAIDMTNMSYATKDPLMRKIIKQIPVPETLVSFIIERPDFVFVANERVFGVDAVNFKIKNTIERAFSPDINVIADSLPYDYKVMIESNIRETYDNEILYYTECTIIVKVFDFNNNTIFQKTYTSEGEGTSYESSSNNAYDNAVVLAERKIYRDIYSYIFK
jgi:hypothetical protein